MFFHRLYNRFLQKKIFLYNMQFFLRVYKYLTRGCDMIATKDIALCLFRQYVL